MEDTKLADIPIEYQSLVADAKKAMAHSYSPYSKFPVGAAVLTSTGKIITGANFESVAHDSICAEQAALAAANAAGETDLKAIAVASADSITPCGQCRQFLLEAVKRQGHDIEVIDYNTTDDSVVTANAQELLPKAFDK